MDTFRVSETARIDAPAPVAYRLIADYREGHPRIVPPQYFRNIVVEEGGYGAGTRFRFEAVALGRTERHRAVVEEPQPGRVLVERLENGFVTSFEVVPAGAGACDVTITTDAPRKPGIAGALEAFVLSRLMPRIFRAELNRLAHVAASGRA